ncbi:hypothetical protein TrRE_jg10059, partial [Triparma retinervis]
MPPPTSLIYPCLTLTLSSILGIYLPSLFPPLLPYIPTLRPFSTGVILSIALCHLLPDGLKGASLIPVPPILGELPIGEAAVVLGFASMTVLESLLPCPHSKSFRPPAPSAPRHGGAAGGMGEVCGANGRIRGLSCDSEPDARDQSDHPTAAKYGGTETSGGENEGLLGRTAEKTGGNADNGEERKLYILEVSIALHSILIGLPVTKSSNGALVTALCIHQFFEGVSLGLAGL